MAKRPTEKTSNPRSSKKSTQESRKRIAQRLKRPRHLSKEAKIRVKEAQKLLKRGRKALDEPIVLEIRAAVDSVAQARRSKEPRQVAESLETLEPLVETHLARYRKGVFREYSESIGLAVLFALMLRAFVVEAFQIPSESMVPTLLVGDHLFVNKFVYGVRIPFTRFDIISFGEPDRGDVVVFVFPLNEVRTEWQMSLMMEQLEREYMNGESRDFPQSLDDVGLGDEVDEWGTAYRFEPQEGESEPRYLLISAGPDVSFGTSDDLNNLNTAIGPSAGDRRCVGETIPDEERDYIKRVIGVPGDRVRIENSHLFVNDVRIEHELFESDPPARDSRYGMLVSQAVEQIDDAEYTIQYRGRMPDFEEITVREDHIFVMGDNRNNSSDSRCWGQVPIENVKGEALFIFWSSGAEDGFLHNRWERMLNGVD